MIEKNYLAREEQKIWEYIQNKEIVDNGLVKDIFPELSENKKNKILHSLFKKGYLQRARKDLYYNQKELRSFYHLALRIRGGYIGLGSALRHYNLIEYEDFTISVMTKSFRKKIELKGTQYTLQFIPLKELFTGFEKKEGIYISSIEKTLFDCFLKPGSVGLTNLTKALYNAKLDWHKFISFFKLADNNSLCQRAGYILGLMKKRTGLKVPSFVFEFLMKRVKNPVKLVTFAGKSVFNKKWMLQDNIGEENILSWWN
ncbi:MAG: hypothetical protein ABIB71_02635 [Candidatus Woesearchaeota archaeon]